MRRPAPNRFFWMIAPLAAVFALGCSSPSEGGDTDGGVDGQTGCGTQHCTSKESCINDAICVRNTPAQAMACHKVESTYQELGPADLTCHNPAACQDSAGCPKDAAQVDLTCRGGFCGLTPPTGAALPATVTFRGCVDAFGIGDTTSQMRVALYTAQQDPTGTSSWDVATTEDRAGCEYWGAFELSAVPTNTPLVFKTYDPNGDFVTTYKYNLVLWPDLAADDGSGTWVLDTRATKLDPRTGQEISLGPWRGYAISQTTYNVILMSVGITTLPENAGALAGTIRDCQYRELSNVTCGVVEKPQVLTYFTNNENPRPETGRTATNTNGIYAAINLPQGAHRLSCLAQDADGTAIPLGEYAFKIFPHAITIVSFDWYPGI